MLLLMLSLLLQDGNRLTYLDGSDPYYPGAKFPKLTTPQWIGEEGVEAAVVLAIDDMRGHDKWEAYLRPILDRLKKIDGRAPVSIMTCTIDPNHPHLQKWLREGVSLEVHTVDHPCPLLQGGDLPKAKSTVDRCIDLLSLVPNSRPVAYRMPCCDSLNTPSPRFYAEIFNKTTPHGNFLTIDSSVFNVTTSADPEVPRELVLDPDGQERFRKYIPFPSFVNTIENYPYPYVIGGTCWEFPCMVPSDWEAQHLLKPNNPRTVADLKAVIDLTVIKKGVFNFVFHPHGWIRNEQVNEVIDYAVEKYGRKVMFLTFREAQERIDKHLLGGTPLRDSKGARNLVWVLDLDHDGYMDVLNGEKTRLWDSKRGAWKEIKGPKGLWSPYLRFAVVSRSGMPSAIANAFEAWRFDGQAWVEDPRLRSGLERGLEVYRDLDGDGICERIQGHPESDGIDVWTEKGWEPATIRLPAALVDKHGHDRGLRFVDLNGDGRDDIVSSNEKEWSVHVWVSMERGWERVSGGKRGDPGEIPMIVRGPTNNGAWFHSKHLWVQNEDTAKMPNLVDRRSFEALLERR